MLDVAFYLLDSVHSPQDFTLILHFSKPPDVDGLRRGAKSAFKRFPISASHIAHQKWVWHEDAEFELESASRIEEFIDEPFDLRRQIPVKQCFIGNRLATRFHHAAADGLSAALWLGHQLNVAYGLEAPQSTRAPFSAPPLRRLQTSVRRSKFAFDSASDPLLTSHSKRSGARGWLTINFPASELQKACRRARGFTYGDLLATCTLEVLSEWNRTHKPGHNRVGLWLPMNIRRESNAGFGNGTSRIRLYRKYDPDASLIEKAREVRRQLAWTSKHGEWMVPNISWFTRFPPSITRPLLHRYLSRPSVDMATAVFSHAGSWIANASEALKHVERIECVGLLHMRQNLAVNAATHAGTTWLTFTYDPQLLTTGDVQQLAQMYQQQIGRARGELL
ncbi:MAG TPA: hypothetical protein VJ875_11920 [Pyrinomonadaceae bacterium]|nr:hypothetical protein [Pyrinomonadaceae bacterium]